ncbi:hypothetical protein LTR66_007268 [Elasticomyces elasticus]|nr:hypothetical protein LTR66_007268 [Elasticomyces elasticus]
MDIPLQNDDGFKWFGEGFDGFPKHLPEDCVEYVIYVIDEKLKQAERRARLMEIYDAAKKLTKKLLGGYIWQREEFGLSLEQQDFDVAGSGQPPEKPAKRKSDGLSYLRGRTNVGDSVADEWLIVYLLCELSKQFPDAWIRVYDTDGEFLLIEAANALPKWLNPEVAENRVWLQNGKLKIIPRLKQKSGAGKSVPAAVSLSLQDALCYISDDLSILEHTPAIEQEAFYRLREYPSAIASSLHRALLTIPRKLAYLLHNNASYISPAVEAFYLRDTVSLRSLQKTSSGHTKPILPPFDLVTVSVKFTKIGYAQLHSQDFAPPPAWEVVLSDTSVDPQNQDKRAVREMRLLYDELENGEDDLPTDADIARWEKGEDDEGWLDINFEDFEKELAGRKNDTSEHEVTKEATGGATVSNADKRPFFGPERPPKSSSADTKEESGFGDQAAQQNLRKMVSRFESFLADDAAGAEGAENDDEDHDSMDSDDDDEDVTTHSDASTATNEEDEAEMEASFRKVLGMDSGQKWNSGLFREARKLANEAEEVEHGDDDGSESDYEDMENIIAQMEAELTQAGALDLSAGRKKRGLEAIKSARASQRLGSARPDQTEKKAASAGFWNHEHDSNVDLEELSSDDEHETNDVDVNLARNLLESLKGQGGMAGPVGNMMGLMGIRMPRDENDQESSE